MLALYGSEGEVAVLLAPVRAGTGLGADPAGRAEHQGRSVGVGLPSQSSLTNPEGGGAPCERECPKVFAAVLLAGHEHDSYWPFPKAFAW